MGYLCANFSLHRPVCSRLRSDVRDRQTSDAHHRLMAPILGAGHSKQCHEKVHLHNVQECAPTALENPVYAMSRNTKQILSRSLVQTALISTAYLLAEIHLQYIQASASVGCIHTSITHGSKQKHIGLHIIMLCCMQ